MKFIAGISLPNAPTPAPTPLPSGVAVGGTIITPTSYLTFQVSAADGPVPFQIPGTGTFFAVQKTDDTSNPVLVAPPGGTLIAGGTAPFPISTAGAWSFTLVGKNWVPSPVQGNAPPVPPPSPSVDMVLVGADASSGPISSFLEASPRPGVLYCVKKTDTTFNAVSVQPGLGRTILGSTDAFTLNTPGESATFLLVGTNWYVTDRYTDWKMTQPIPLFYDLLNSFVDEFIYSPTKGDRSAPNGIDSMVWTRRGAFLEGVCNYRQQSPGVDDHSAEYLVQLPTGLLIKGWSEANGDSTDCYGSSIMNSSGWSINARSKSANQPGLEPFTSGEGQAGSLVPSRSPRSNGFCFWSGGGFGFPKFTGAISTITSFGFHCLIPIVGWH